MNEQPCPGCGLAVAPGYLRCPRCHVVMPGMPITPSPSTSPRDPGGTSLADGGRGPALWIAAVAIAVAVAVVAVIILMRNRGGGDDHGSAAP
ncbi:MAG TPA: hypothetical protein VL172_06450, partial [Kofleriaceae bacterium]|nr:hypothetical protein [Kofleriaceae bacterium]